MKKNGPGSLNYIQLIPKNSKSTLCIFLIAGEHYKKFLRVFLNPKKKRVYDLLHLKKINDSFQIQYRNSSKKPNITIEFIK